MSQDNEVGGRQIFGQSSDECYEPYATAWAKIVQTNTGESFETNRSIVNISYEVTIRYRKNVVRNQKIRFRGRLFNIENVINLGEANRFLQISVTEET